MKRTLYTENDRRQVIDYLNILKLDKVYVCEVIEKKAKTKYSAE